MINENSRLPNRHCVILAKSGSGKSHLLRVLIAHEKRQVLWDPNRDFTAHHIADKRVYYRELVRAANSGRPFRLALVTEQTPENFDLWARMVASILDGNRPTAVVCDEMSLVQKVQGKASADWTRVVNQARKYGGRIYAAAQRVQKIDKDIVTQCHFRFAGVQGSLKDRAVVCDLVDATTAEVKALKPRNFLFISDDMDRSRLYKAPAKPAQWGKGPVNIIA